MIMDKISQVMDDYLSTVSEEQFEQDLIKAGILNCPEKTWVEIPASSLVLGNYKVGQESSWTILTEMTYQANPIYLSNEEKNNILYEDVA